MEGAYTGVTLGSIASETFTLAHEQDTMFEVIQRFWQTNASMIVVVRGTGTPSACNVAGVITKEHIADSVADSVRPYVGAGATLAM